MFARLYSLAGGADMFVTRSRFGVGQFDFTAKPREFYNIYLGLIFLSIAIGFFAFLVFLGFGAIVSSFDSPTSSPVVATIGAVVPMFISFAIYLFFYVFVQVNIRNLVFNNTVVSNTYLESTLQLGEMYRLYLMNTIAMVCSMGLLTPWAMVRLARYRAEHTSLKSTQKLEKIDSRNSRDGSAVGEEVGEMFDVGVGI